MPAQVFQPDQAAVGNAVDIPLRDTQRAAQVLGILHRDRAVEVGQVHALRLHLRAAGGVGGLAAIQRLARGRRFLLHLLQRLVQLGTERWLRSPGSALVEEHQVAILAEGGPCLALGEMRKDVVHGGDARATVDVEDRIVALVRDFSARDRHPQLDDAAVGLVARFAYL